MVIVITLLTGKGYIIIAVFVNFEENYKLKKIDTLYVHLKNDSRQNLSYSFKIFLTDTDISICLKIIRKS